MSLKAFCDRCGKETKQNCMGAHSGYQLPDISEERDWRFCVCISYKNDRFSGNALCEPCFEELLTKAIARMQENRKPKIQVTREPSLFSKMLADPSLPEWEHL
jgi:hypothetical protein